LGQVGLEGTLDQSPFTLSEGEKRRLTAACGALAGADILVLDEPSAGLDPRSTGALAALVRRAAASGSAVVCATHDEAFARILGGRDLNLARWSRSLADTPVPRREPEVQPGPPGLDPRFGFCLFLATLGLAAFPWPLEVAAALLGALVLLYPVAGRLRELGAFARPLAVFWVTPGLVLWALAGPEAALAGSVRLGLLSLLFHRYSLLVEGKELSASLAKWGLPYSAGFALTAALNLVPTLGTRLGRIHEILVLRLTPGRGRRSFPSVRVVAAMLVPTVVHLWQMAVRLAMNLELRGFEGLSPDQALAKTKKSD
jgi:energy-coupling factor transporter transmembrane protein EcfT